MADSECFSMGGAECNTKSATPKAQDRKLTGLWASQDSPFGIYNISEGYPKQCGVSSGTHGLIYMP